MKLSKLIRIAVIGLLVGKAIVYGSTKNTNLVRRVHRTRPTIASALSAATETGTTNTFTTTATLQLPEGQSCAVGVFMGTAEDVDRSNDATARQEVTSCFR